MCFACVLQQSHHPGEDVWPCMDSIRTFFRSGEWARPSHGSLLHCCTADERVGRLFGALWFRSMVKLIIWNWFWSLKLCQLHNAVHSLVPHKSVNFKSISKSYWHRHFLCVYFDHKTSFPGVTCRCCTSAWSTVWPTTQSWQNVSSARLLVSHQRTRLSSTKWQWSPFRMESESRSNRRPHQTRAFVYRGRRATIITSHRIKELLLKRKVGLSSVGVLILCLSVASAGRTQSAYSLTQWRRSKP